MSRVGSMLVSALRNAAITLVIYAAIKFILLCFWIKINEAVYPFIGTDVSFFQAIRASALGFQHWFTTVKLIFAPAWVYTLVLSLGFVVSGIVSRARNKKTHPHLSPNEFGEEMMARIQAGEPLPITAQPSDREHINGLYQRNTPELGLPSETPPKLAALLRASSRPSIIIKKAFPVDFTKPCHSFFGGLPVAPAEFNWPFRRTATQKRMSLPFFGQLDFAELPDTSLRALFPKTGVLYFFAGENGVIYHDTPVSDRMEIMPPQNLDIYDGGMHSQFSHTWLLEDAHTAPRKSLYPKWPIVFCPHQEVLEVTSAFNEMAVRTADLSAAECTLYTEICEERVSQSMTDVFGPELAAESALSAYNDAAKTGLWKPFAAFPHAWIAVETLSLLVQEKLLASAESITQRLEQYRLGALARGAKEQMSEQDVLDLISQEAVHGSFFEVAQSWVDKANANGLGTAPSASDKVSFWAWWALVCGSPELHMQGRSGRHKQNTPYFMNMLMDSALTHSVDACCSFSAQTAALVPSSVKAGFARRHTQNKPIHLPHKMLGYPTQIQNAADLYADTHLLLAEFHYDEGNDWIFGDMGVFQFWITPDALSARDFGQTIVTVESS